MWLESDGYRHILDYVMYTNHDDACIQHILDCNRHTMSDRRQCECLCRCFLILYRRRVSLHKDTLLMRPSGELCLLLLLESVELPTSKIERCYVGVCCWWRVGSWGGMENENGGHQWWCYDRWEGILVGRSDPPHHLEFILMLFRCKGGVVIL